MGEGRSRERRSYYIESSQRKGCPPIIPILEAVGRYKGRNTKGEWGAVRCSVKKKARKISESVFGSVRRALGMEPKTGTGMGAIPEQHVPSTRMHFRDYAAPEEVFGTATAAAATVAAVAGGEGSGGSGSGSGSGGIGGAGREQNLVCAAPGRFGSGNREINNNLKEKPKIRSNYVISKPPTIHYVPSSEMIRSDVGSIRDLTPPSSFGRKFSAAASIGTVSTGTWNSTIASRMTSRTLRGDGLHVTAAASVAVDKRDLMPVPDADAEPAGERGGEGYFHLPPKRERRNVDARWVYSALVRKLHQEEDDRKAGQLQPAQSEMAAAAAAAAGYYMAPDIGLLPKEEGIFERHPSNNAPPQPQSLSGRPPSLKKRGSDATIKPEPAPYCGSESPPPPPVPKIPRVWLEDGVTKTFGEPRARYPQGIQLGVPLAESLLQGGVSVPMRSAAAAADERG